jgi:serine/threonine protein kinase
MVHSDLKLNNVLVDATSTSLNLSLCDFGGSKCGILELNGNHFPDNLVFTRK